MASHIKTICYLGSANSTHVRRLCEAFAEKGYQVHLISLVPQQSPIEGIKLHVVPIIFKSRIFNFLLNSLYVKHHLEKLSPNIIHAVFSKHLWVLGRDKQSCSPSNMGLGRRRSKSTFHQKKSQSKNKLLAPFWNLTTSVALKRADKIFVESIYTSKFIQKIFGLPSTKILPAIWGIDLKQIAAVQLGEKEKESKWFKRLCISPGSIIILSPRTMRSLYGIEKILYSIPIIRGEFPNVLYILLRGYGEEFYVNYIKKLAEKLGVKENIRIIDYLLSPQEVFELMQISQILISIPTEDSLPITVLEGLFWGCVPILSEIPANKELISYGIKAFLVKGHSYEALANALLEALRKKVWLCSEFVENNKKWVLNNAVQQKTVKKIEQIYYQLVGKC